MFMEKKMLCFNIIISGFNVTSLLILKNIMIHIQTNSFKINKNLK